MLKNFLLLILKGLRYRPIRSWLTILGIIIGIMLVIVIMSLSSGIKNVIANQLQMFGSDLIIVIPGKETNPFTSFLGGEKFRESDLLALKKINGVRLVMPVEIAVLNVEFRGEKKSTMFHAMPWKEYRIISEESRGLQVIEGSWPENDDESDMMLGYKAAYSLFKNKVHVGDDIIVKGKRFKVRGVFQELGMQDEDNQMYLSNKSLQALLSKSSTAATGIIKVNKGVNIDLVARQVKFELGKQEVVRDFSVLTPEKANKIVGNILSIIELVLVTIAIISLLVGAVGIMNTMYTSVLERTKQIGIMKAVGASKNDILSLFLIESGIIGLVGGLMGLILGIFSAYLVGLVAGRLGIRGLFSFASLDYFEFFVVLVITFIIGITSGVFPAKKASEMEPAEALRYE